ncbi:MAG: hypothetical protein PHN94_14150, partial [Bacteroidales bacterium]|nr:hypothetical protein [Bacteroidales bacterium]
MKILITIMTFTLLAFSNLHAQTVSGKVYGVTEDGKKEVLPGVNIYWAYSLQGTTSDIQGNFKITLSRNAKSPAGHAPDDDGNNHDGHDEHLLVFSFIGYQKDTIHVHENMKQVEIVLRSDEYLEGVEIAARQKGSHISRMDPILTQNISGAELHKAACCNLSESFETNASVDVNYSDALTGAKQIQLLGLAGIYSQLMTENIP